MATRPVPASRAAYATFRPVPTRWMDGDVYGHVNNVVHYAMFDTAVNGWLMDRGLLDPRTSAVIGLVVETGCRYTGEIVFPDRVDVGVKVTHIGRSSVRYDLGLFRNDDDRTSAEGFFVHVYVDARTRRPVPLSQEMRDTLDTLRAPD